MEIIDEYDSSKLTMVAEKRKLRNSIGNGDGTSNLDGQVVGADGADGDDAAEKRSDLMSSYIELNEAKQRLRLLEMKIQNLENRISKKYPDVVFLNYKNRKRILVSDSLPAHFR